MSNASAENAGQTFEARRWAAAIGYVGAGLAFGAGLVVKSPDLGDPVHGMEILAQYPSSGAIDILYAVCVALALTAVAHLVRGKGARLVTVGAYIAIFGNLGHAAIAMVEWIGTAMVGSQASRAAMIAVLDSVNGHAGLAVTILLMMMGYLAGSLVVTIGLVRARVVSFVPLLLLAIAIACDFIPLGGLEETIKLSLGSLTFFWLAAALVWPRRSTADSQEQNAPVAQSIAAARQ